MIMPKKMFVFDADDGGGSGGNGEPVVTTEQPKPPVETEVETQAQTPPGGDTTGGKPTEAPQSDGGRISMTPKQMADRLERAKSGEREALAKTLGFESVEALQATVEAGKKALDAQKTAEERQAEELKKATDRSAALERQMLEAQQERDRIAVRAAVVEKMAGKFIDPGAAFRLLDTSNLKLADGGVVDGLDDAIADLAQRYPWTLVSKAEPEQKKIQPRVVTNPDGGPIVPKENDADRRQRYFGEGVQVGFFKGGGVKETSVRTNPKKTES